MRTRKKKLDQDLEEPGPRKQRNKTKNVCREAKRMEVLWASTVSELKCMEDFLKLGLV